MGINFHIDTKTRYRRENPNSRTHNQRNNNNAKQNKTRRGVPVLYSTIRDSGAWRAPRWYWELGKQLGQSLPQS